MVPRSTPTPDRRRRASTTSPDPPEAAASSADGAVGCDDITEFTDEEHATLRALPRKQYLVPGLALGDVGQHTAKQNRAPARNVYMNPIGMPAMRC